MLTTSPRSRATLVAALALGGVLALAGCAASAQTSDDSAAQTSQQGPAPADRGVSGTIAASEDGLLQVQNTDEQTAVSYTADTAISSQVAGSLDDVAVGDCVVAITEEGAEAASTVIVTDPVDGECTGGFGGAGAAMTGGPGGGGTPPEGAPTDMPTGMPTDGEAPEGAPTGAAAFGTLATGAVTAVTGSTLTVETTDPEGETGTEEVAVGDDTVVTVTVEADAAALVVGQCVTAQGEADDAGGFAATSLLVTEPGDDGCSLRMGGAFPGGAGGPADGGPAEGGAGSTGSTSEDG